MKREDSNRAVGTRNNKMFSDSASRKSGSFALGFLNRNFKSDKNTFRNLPKIRFLPLPCLPVSLTKCRFCQQIGCGVTGFNQRTSSRSLTTCSNPSAYFGFLPFMLPKLFLPLLFRKVRTEIVFSYIIKNCLFFNWTIRSYYNRGS